MVICSPRATASRFVEEEIRYFKEIGKSDHILALMIDGEPNVSRDPAKQAAGFDPALECLPEPLRCGAPGADGTIDWTQLTEPIAADARPGGLPNQGFTTVEAYRQWLDRQGGTPVPERRAQVQDYALRLDLSALKIVAGVIGVPLGELTQRDKAYQLEKERRRSRLVRRVAVGFVLLALLAVAGAIIAWAQRGQARKEYQRAEGARQAKVEVLATSYYDQALALLAADRLPEALPYVAASLRLVPGHPLATRMAAALLLDPRLRLPSVRPPEAGRLISAGFAPDGRRAVLNWIGHSPDWYDLQAGRTLGPIPLDQRSGNAVSASFSAGGSCVLLDMMAVHVWPPGELNARPAAQTRMLGFALGDVLLTANAGDSVFTVTKSDVDKLFTSISGDSPIGRLRIVNNATGSIQDLKAHEGLIKAMVAIPGSDQFLTVGSDHFVRQWQPGETTPVAEYRLPAAGLCLAVSPRGNWAVAGAKEATVLQMDLLSHKSWALANIPVTWNARAAAFSPDGRRLAVGFGQSGANEGYVRIWDASTSIPLTNAQACGDWVNHLAFDKGGGRLGYVCAEGKAGLLDAVTGLPLASWQAGTQGDGVSFVADRNALAVAADERTVRIFPAHADVPPQLSIALPDRVQSLAVDASGERAVAVLGTDRTAHVWVSLRDGKMVGATIPHPGQPINRAHLVGGAGGPVVLLLFDDGAVEVWDVAGHRLARHAAAPGLFDIIRNGTDAPEGMNLGFPFAKRFSTGPEQLLVGLVLLKQAEIRQVIEDLQKQAATPGSVPPDPGTVVQKFQGLFSGRIEGWDPVTLAKRWSLECPMPVANPSLSRDGKTLTAMNTSTGRLFVWRRDTLARPWSAPAALPPVSSEGQAGQTDALINYALSPDGRWLCALGSEARVCDLQAPTLQWRTLAAGDAPLSLAMAPADPLVALELRSNQDSGVVQIWNMATGLPVTAKLPHGDTINAMEFSPGGQTLATATDERCVRVWDVGSGRLALPLVKTLGYPKGIAFTDGGRALVCGGNDRQLTLLPIPPAGPTPDWVPAALEALGGNRLDESGQSRAVSMSGFFDCRNAMLAPAGKDGAYWPQVAAWLWHEPGATLPGTAWTRRKLLLLAGLNARRHKDDTLAQVRLREALREPAGNEPIPPGLQRLAGFLEEGQGEHPTMESWDGWHAGEAVEGPAGMRFRWCPPGRFVMGSPSGEPGRQWWEVPHAVTLTSGFWMSETEVTQAQWEQIMGQGALDHALEKLADTTPFNRQGAATTALQATGLKDAAVLRDWTGWFLPGCPMNLVSAPEADDFARRLGSIWQPPSAPTGKPTHWSCTLPSEAQWEYACRAGTTQATYAGAQAGTGKFTSLVLSSIAWYGGNSSVDHNGPGWPSKDWVERESAGDTAGIHPVGLKDPNPWGLRDMLGDVFEWCADGWVRDLTDGSVNPLPDAGGFNRACRGGAADTPVAANRAAARFNEPPAFRGLDLGFRVIFAPEEDE